MIQIQLVHPDAKVPTCAHPGEDLCYDLYAVEDKLLLFFQPTLIPTGIKLGLPEGYGALIRPRSGLSKKGVLVGGGEIDNGYRGEIFVMLTLLPVRDANYPWLPSTYQIKKGDRIAQIRLEEIRSTEQFEVVDELSTTQRGEGGFGSTGR